MCYSRQMFYMVKKKRISSVVWAKNVYRWKISHLNSSLNVSSLMSAMCFLPFLLYYFYVRSMQHIFYICCIEQKVTISFDFYLIFNWFDYNVLSIAFEQMRLNSYFKWINTIVQSFCDAQTSFAICFRFRSIHVWFPVILTFFC